MKKIYLDYNATTPLHKEVIEAMQPFISEYFGNPSSAHWYGMQAKMAVGKAREQVAILPSRELLLPINQKETIL